MKKTFKNVISSITYNFKSLLIFELIYRALGLVAIFPLVRLLFHLSIQLSGLSYITNTSLIAYATRPMTVIILLLVLIILSVYMVIELIFLSVIFDYGYHEKDLSLKTLLVVGMRKLYETTVKYRLRIIMPAFLFFILVELFHIVGIASTINIPQVILDQVNQSLWLQGAFIGLIIIASVLFLETVFSINHYVIEKLSTQKAFRESRRMLKGNRFRLIVEFLLLNIILNGILYLFYALLIFLVGLFVSLTKGELYTLSVVLTIFYGLYSFIALLSTLILLPVNFALISTWYYESREKLGIILTSTPRTNKPVKLISNLWIKRSLILGILVIFSINLVNIISILGSPKTALEFLNVAEIVAHRGASWDAPENTIAAIELAIFQGADVVEIDIRETRDMVPVLMHDATTFRTTNDTQRRRINNMSLEEVKTLDAGSWFSPEFAGESIPTLEEALIVIKGRARVFIELKVDSQTLENTVLDLITSLDMVQDSTILSFNQSQLIRIKQKNPDVSTLLLLSSFYGDIDALVRQHEIDMFGFSESLFKNNPNYVESIHRHQKKVYVWTINSAQSLKDVVDLDADGIITDRPVLAREIAYSKNTSELLIEILNRFFKKDVN
jgi:glycerophosphoryl diester phosphodiesterase